MTTASTYPSLLPPNATALEEALSGAGGRLTALRTDIERVWDWEACPNDMLPWLAWAMSVDLWDKDWPEEKKRAIIRDSFYLHQKKGTLYGIERYLNFASATLHDYILPPDNAFAGASLTPAERKDWLGRFPQIRIFEYRDRGTWQRGGYLGAGANELPICATGAKLFPNVTDAWIRYGRRAFLWDKGSHPLATGADYQLGWTMVTRQVDGHQQYSYEQVRIGGVFVQSLFCGTMGNVGRKDWRLFPIEKGNAGKRIATVEILRNYVRDYDAFLYYYPVSPSLEPIQVYPDHIAEKGTSRHGINVFCGMPGRWLDPETGERKRIKCYLMGYLPETTSPTRLYDVIYLHDKARLPDKRLQGIYAGHTRLGMPMYNARLDVQITGHRSLYQFGQFVFGCASASDMKPLHIAMDAVRRSKSERDKILLKTGLHRQIRSTDRIRSGDGHTTRSLVLDSM